MTAMTRICTILIALTLSGCAVVNKPKASDGYTSDITPGNNGETWR